MPPNSSTTARWLTYAGILPFAAGLAGQLFAPEAAPWREWTAAYGAVIAAFIAGIHWAVHLFYGDKAPINLLISSNVLALAAWGALLLPAGPGPFRLLVVVFLALVLIDRRLHRVGLIPDWFYRLRLQASAAVSLCLLGMAAAVM
jgi:hypothetical protein